MFNLAEPDARAASVVPAWRACERCEELFPAMPGVSLCADCELAGLAWVDRCEAAYPEDWAACEGALDAVRVVDRVGDEVRGCVRHAAVALASVEGARVVAGSVEGAALEAHTLARQLELFDAANWWPAAYPTVG